MDARDLLRRRVTVLAGYGLLGLVVTVAVGLVALNVTVGLQPEIYDLLYLRVGPSRATEVAILGQFLLAIAIAISGAMLAGDTLSDRGANLRRLGVGVGAMLAVVVVFVALAALGIEPAIAVVVLLPMALLAVPLGLRYGLDLRSGALPAFIGAIPVVVLLVLLAGVGLGWGWGYVVTAEAVSASDVDGPVVGLEDVPAVRDDLLVTGDCEATDTGQRCDIQLRGYEHELTAVRFLADHGVRCPYQGTSDDAATVYVRHEETHYRVTCSPHGD
ncbi:MAG: hypothetical protein ACLFMX_00385 [Halobacteriales archaeon]